MNLQQLEYFTIIARTKKIITAAEELSVSQPALSKAISKLEEELDVKLFEREGRSIKITSYGETFLKYAKSALEEIDRGIDKIEELKKAHNTVISIASTSCIGITFIPFIISGFLNSHEHARFNLTVKEADEMMKDLKYGRIQFAFIDQIDTIKNYPEIEATFIKQEEFVVIVSKSHHLSNKEVISLQDLKDEYFIPYQANKTSSQVSLEDLLGFAPKIAVEQCEETLLASLVAAGVGIAIVVNTPILNTNTLSILKIEEEVGYKQIYLATNKGSMLSKTASNFHQFVMGEEN